MMDDNPSELRNANGDRPEYPRRLRLKESAFIAERRRCANPGYSDSDGVPTDAVGLAFSGGGIRSATFCLGVLQSLARHKLLRKIDILSTVSGGGYCGSFLGAMMSPRSRSTGKDVRATEDELADPKSAIVGWLRENGRYLSPNGAGDAWLAFAVFLRNWIAVQTVLFTLVVAGLAGVVLLRLLLTQAFGLSTPRTTILGNPFWWFPVACLLMATPLGWAYWMVPRFNPQDKSALSLGPLRRSVILVALLAIVLAGLLLTAAPDNGQASGKAALLIGSTGVIIVLLTLALAAVAGAYGFARATEDGTGHDRQMRNRLSGYLAHLLKLAALTAALALIDSLGEALYLWLQPPGGFGLWRPGAGLVGLGGVATVIRWLIRFAQQGDSKARFPLPIGVVAGLAAALTAGATLIALSAAVHATMDLALLVPGPAEAAGNQIGSLVVLLIASTLLSIVFGRTIRFANDSSHQALYGARLARAYLGASNPTRLTKTGAARNVTEPISGDDMPLNDYRPFTSGGPLHLINVTVNETVAGESQVEHRDRKGLGMAVGPAGLSVGVRHHALWRETKGGGADVIEPIAPTSGYQMFISSEPPADAESQPLQKVEPLSVATWVAISGAAVAPGLGSRTSIGFSVLLTLFNIRMGYWWESYINPSARGVYATRRKRLQRLGAGMARLFPVQTYLFYELLARFYGPNRRHWYLTDGGHFENTAAYELLRRRLPLIIVCDCGQDARYQFADVANLVRKARTDFSAEIRFIPRNELESWGVDPRITRFFGVPGDFRPFVSAESSNQRPPEPRPCAMLARVDYDGTVAADGQPGTVMLFVKPSLVGDEPEDVLNYAKVNADFPQQSTGDQYFDEAQWEAYRELGEFSANRLFQALPEAHGQPAAWSPHSCGKPVLKPGATG